MNLSYLIRIALIISGIFTLINSYTTIILSYTSYRLYVTSYDETLKANLKFEILFIGAFIIFTISLGLLLVFKNRIIVNAILKKTNDQIILNVSAVELLQVGLIILGVYEFIIYTTSVVKLIVNDFEGINFRNVYYIGFIGYYALIACLSFLMILFSGNISRKLIK